MASVITDDAIQDAGARTAAMRQEHEADVRRWLCIAWAFPPVNRSGTHRTLGFVRHLHHKDWRASVITADPSGENCDGSLSAMVPTGTRVIPVVGRDLIRTIKRLIPGRRPMLSGSVQASAPQPMTAEKPPRSFRDWVSRMLTTPDNRLGWVWPAYRAALAEARHHKFELIYSTSPCMSAHLVAMLVAHRTGLPWVADFRDPWRGNPFRDLVYRTINAWDAWLERRVFRRANRIIGNTPTMTAALVQRMPGLKSRCRTILNGFDDGLLDGVRAYRSVTGDHCLLTHSGQFYGARSPQVWLRALQGAHEIAPQTAGRIRLQFVGSVEYDGVPLRDIVRACGLAWQVSITGFLSHTEALGRVLGSDAVLLAGFDGPGATLQIPHKLFEYLVARRPILATLPPGHPAIDLLRNARAVAQVCQPRDVGSLARALIAMAAGRVTPAPDAWSGVDRFARVERALELESVFNELVGAPPPSTATIPSTRSAPRRSVTLERTTAERAIHPAIGEWSR